MTTQMNRNSLVIAFATVGLGAATLWAAYDLSWYTFDGGGVSQSTGGTFSLSGTVGQHDAGKMSGGTFVLTGGFWSATGASSPPICEGDANQDGAVDPLDSGFVLSRFGCDVGGGDTSCDAAEMNGDGIVDPLDAGFVLSRFGDCG